MTVENMMTAEQAASTATALQTAIGGLYTARTDAETRVKTATVDAIAKVVETAKAHGAPITEAAYNASMHPLMAGWVKSHAAANSLSEKSLERLAWAAKWLLIAASTGTLAIPEADSRDWQKAGGYARIHADTVPGLALKAKGAAGGRPGKAKGAAAEAAKPEAAPAQPITEPHPVDAVMTIEKAAASLFPGEQWAAEATAFIWLFQNNHRKTVGNMLVALHGKHKPKNAK